MDDDGIDWHAQWKAFARGFKGGYGHIDLKEYGYSERELVIKNPLKMEPGPGFGDLSHPTTRLVIALMNGKVSGKYCVDIGCGSGVLTLCALALGARFVDGIDIDSGAVAHAQTNAVLNHFESKARFSLPSEYSFPKEETSALIFMNMISSEQKEAWNSLPSIHSVPGIAIVSGILSEELESYSHFCRERRWRLLEEKEEDEWVGMCWEPVARDNNNLGDP